MSWIFNVESVCLLISSGSIEHPLLLLVRIGIKGEKEDQEEMEMVEVMEEEEKELKEVVLVHQSQIHCIEI